MNGDDKCVHCNSSVHVGGPIYTAPIQDEAFVAKMIQRFVVLSELMTVDVLELKIRLKMKDLGLMIVFLES